MAGQSKTSKKQQTPVKKERRAASRARSKEARAARNAAQEARHKANLNSPDPSPWALVCEKRAQSPARKAARIRWNSQNARMAR